MEWPVDMCICITQKCNKQNYKWIDFNKQVPDFEEKIIMAGEPYGKLNKTTTVTFIAKKGERIYFTINNSYIWSDLYSHWFPMDQLIKDMEFEK